jgi:hypothetical protein
MGKLTRSWIRALVMTLAASAATTLAEPVPGVINADRARTNYMLNCQGCHGHDGTGNADADVPRMKDFVSSFLRVPGGREFLIQVPGTANAALPDDQLAELMNWLLPTISAAQLPADFVPFGAAEVGRLRSAPETDVAGRRTRLIADLNRLGLAPP